MIISKPIVVFDIETTGLDIINDRIVDISLIKVNSDNSTIKYNGEIFFIYNKWQGFVLRLLYDRLKKPINIKTIKEILKE